jgi:hypothetical protein
MRPEMNSEIPPTDCCHPNTVTKSNHSIQQIEIPAKVYRCRPIDVDNSGELSGFLAVV